MHQDRAKHVVSHLAEDCQPLLTNNEICLDGAQNWAQFASFARAPSIRTS